MMKSVKYLILLTAALFSFAGCSDDDDVFGGRNVGKERPEVAITPGSVTNKAAAFTLSVSGNVLEYGYVVLQDTGLVAPSAYEILTNSVSGTVSRGIYNYADAASANVTFACEADENYTVFAAAITESGLTSRVQAMTLDVDDTEGPIPSSFQALSGNSLVVTFGNERQLYFTKSEDIQATVRYHKVGASREEDKVVITEPETLPRENITINGSNVTFVVTSHPGSTFLVDIPSGLFTDAAGNPCTGVINHYNEATGDFTAAHGDTPASPFAILQDYFEKPGATTDWSAEGACLRFTVPAVVYADKQVKNGVRVVYNEGDGVKYLNAEYDLARGTASSTVTVYLPKAPEGIFDLDIVGGTFFDEWGNASAAFKVAPEDFRYRQEIVIRTGVHSVNYDALSDFTQEDILSQTSGTSFKLHLQPYTETGEDGLYMLGVQWFNMNNESLTGFGLPDAGKTVNPILLGKVNYATKTIVFDGRCLNPQNLSILKDNALNTAFYANNEELKNADRLLVFQGGGEDGKEPITITFDEEGNLKTISKCGFIVRKYQGEDDGQFVAYYDAIWETGTLSPEN